MTHLCHWPGCKRDVPPSRFACKAHWFSLPKFLRDEIWRTYRPGQEITKTPSREYIAAAIKVQNWIRAKACPINKASAISVCQQCGQWWEHSASPPSCPERGVA